MEVTWLSAPTNAADKSLLEIRLFYHTSAGTTLETNITNNLCMTNQRLTLLKTVYESDSHLMPLHHPIRLLTPCYHQIAVAFDFTTAAARSVNLNLGVLFPRTENIQRILIFYSDNVDNDAMLYAETGQAIQSISDGWGSTTITVPSGDTEGYRLFRNGKIVADGTSFTKRVRLGQRMSRRMFGQDQGVPEKGSFTSSVPYGIDLAPASGHDSGGSPILGGISNTSQNEWVLTLYFPSTWTDASHHGGVIHCIMESQRVVEIENHGRPASEVRPTITALVN